MSNNKLQGPLPVSISKHVSLYHVNVSFNNLSSPMESKMFSKLKNLQTANLSHNPLLSVNTFSNVNYTLPKLYELYLSCCNFREFPSFLTNLENLEKLDLFPQPNQRQYTNLVIWCGEEFFEIFESRESIPYRRLYRFGQRYDIFRILVNTGVLFQIYRYFFIFINKYMCVCVCVL